ncbi:MAG: 50S ribosomal protein L19 [Myxococcales bacterium]|nr:50S ribosomal protein L19 [Myxococcales bacterium]
MNTVIDDVESPYVRSDLPALRVGDTVRVHTKIREGTRERVQIFEGIIIAYKKGGNRASITVRKVSHSVGVERVFPLSSPTVNKIEVKSHGQIRRAKLYYLRNLSGKAARIKERTDRRPPSTKQRKKAKTETVA